MEESACVCVCGSITSTAVRPVSFKLGRCFTLDPPQCSVQSIYLWFKSHKNRFYTVLINVMLRDHKRRNSNASAVYSAHMLIILNLIIFNFYPQSINRTEQCTIIIHTLTLLRQTTKQDNGHCMFVSNAAMIMT